MDDRYSEHVDWKAAVLALMVWAAHFSVLWGASSVFPGNAAARWIALAATIAAAGALVWLWPPDRARGPVAIPRTSIGLAAAAIGFGAMPALIG